MTTKINGRTPEEIKLGLVHCLTAREYRNCLVCPYGTSKKRGMLPCDCEVRQDILALIDQLQEDKKQLERERDEARNDLDTINYANTELHSAYEAMKRERDAAVEDIKKAAFCGCHVCEHYYRPDPNVRKYACRKFGDFDKVDFIADDGSIYCGAMNWRGPQEVN